MDAILAQLSGDPLTNNAILAVIALAVLDFITGTLRAVAGKTFTWDALDVWVRKHLLAVVMIVLVLVFGRFVGNIQVGDTNLAVMTASGLLAAASFSATSVKSIIDNLNTSTNDGPPEA